MSSRSNGVMYWVLSSVIRSRVMPSPAVSTALTRSCVTPEFGMLAEATLHEPGHFERVLARASEEDEELAGARCERDFHATAHVNQFETSVNAGPE